MIHKLCNLLNGGSFSLSGNFTIEQLQKYRTRKSTIVGLGLTEAKALNSFFINFSFFCICKHWLLATINYSRALE